MTSVSKTILNTTAERALIEGDFNCLVVTFYQNERPPSGLAGILDWYFQGALSYYLRSNAIKGEAGECVYLPLTRHGSTFHILLAGSGHSPQPGKRGAVPAATLHALKKNLLALHPPKVGISKSDFGNAGPEFFSKHFEGVPLWITP